MNAQLTKKVQKIANGYTTATFRNGTRKFSAVLQGNDFQLITHRQFENNVETFATAAELQTAMREVAPISKWSLSN